MFIEGTSGRNTTEQSNQAEAFYLKSLTIYVY